MSFVKLDADILQSTLWLDREAREIFITALLLSMPRDFTEPIRQISVRSLDETGFTAPPGWYGFAPVSGPGLIHRAIVELTPGLAALERLGAEEPGSRTPLFGGRRLIRVEGGYVVLNFMAYHDKDHTASERMQRYRKRQLLLKETRNVNKETRNVAHSEVRGKSEEIQETPSPVVPRPRNPLFDALVEITGANPAVSGGEIGKALAAIKIIMPDVTPEEIRRRAANYKTQMPDCTMSALALAKWWPKCDIAGSGHTGKPRLSAAEFSAASQRDDPFGEGPR
jgi:hypothetical protein